MTGGATRTAKTALRALLAAAAGAAVGLALAAAGPFVVGGRTFTVLSGSMEPSIHTGDLVATETISPREARVGDIVTFPDPERGDHLVTHRLRSIRIEGGAAKAITKGDANNTVERWSAPADGRIGRVVYRLPKLGYLLDWGSSPGGRLVLLLVPGVGLALLALMRIWREPDTRATRARSTARRCTRA